MRTSSAKAKGRRLAVAVQKALLDVFTDLTTDDIRVTPSGVPGPDLQLSQAGREALPYDFECKNQESLNIWATWRQIEERLKSSSEGLTPIIVYARNRVTPKVSVSLLHFGELLFNTQLLDKYIDKFGVIDE